ncbi:MAG: hypothetical protein ACYDAI_08460 [Trichloromonadaceae bacterium]
MAEMLKRQFDLLTLKVSLNTSESQTQIRCELEGRVGESFEPLHGWEFPTHELGLPERLERRQSLYQGYAFSLPADFRAGLVQAVAEENPEGLPLWLHLAKPYGYLGMVPWERLLQPELKLPILRLPDFLANPPRETPSVLDVVLCSSLPLAKESFMVIDHLTRMAQGILDAVPRQTTIHMFTDREWYPQLRSQVNNLGLDGPVIVHNPEAAVNYPAPEATVRVGTRQGGIENPWLLWIRDALQGRSIDIAHFVCHGYLAGDLGALAFSETPVRNQDRQLARFVGAAELTAFLTQVGAWSAAFSSPEHNYCEMGLRQLADSIAQLRPGPIIHHELPGDTNGQALAAVYRFLFGPALEPPPASPALFTYCHPSRLSAAPEARSQARYTPRASVEAAGEAVAHPLFKSLFETADNLPSWIAASERFFEQQNLQLRKMAREPGSERQRTAQGLRQTLEQIQEIIAKAAETTRSGGQP